MRRRAEIFCAHRDLPTEILTAVAFEVWDSLCGIFGRYQGIMRVISRIMKSSVYIDTPAVEVCCTPLSLLTRIVGTVDPAVPRRVSSGVTCSAVMTRLPCRVPPAVAVRERAADEHRQGLRRDDAVLRVTPRAAEREKASAANHRGTSLIPFGLVVVVTGGHKNQSPFYVFCVAVV